MELITSLNWGPLRVTGFIDYIFHSNRKNGFSCLLLFTMPELAIFGHHLKFLARCLVCACFRATPLCTTINVL